MATIISLNTAKLAKDKGFDLASPAYYGCDDPASGESNQFMIKVWMKVSDLNTEDTQQGTLIYSAPYQSDLRDWLREKHNVNILITQEERDETWWYEIFHNFRRVRLLYEDISHYEFFTHDTALEKALFESLKLI